MKAVKREMSIDELVDFVLNIAREMRKTNYLQLHMKKDENAIDVSEEDWRRFRGYDLFRAKFRSQDEIQEFLKKLKKSIRYPLTYEEYPHVGTFIIFFT